MLVYVATTNQGKLRELRELTADSGLELLLDEAYVAVPEDHPSYVENAATKARALHDSLSARGIRAAVLADDSGLEIAALQGRPGIHSARYGGERSWEARRRLLLEEIGDGVDRAARFICALHFIEDRGKERVVTAFVEGEITKEERGERGFSYDPIFLYPPLGRTFAELTPHEKNTISHRGRAVSKLLTALDAAKGDHESEGVSRGRGGAGCSSAW
jgi:XTP/dITP diphosphohydrolase